MLFLVAFTLGFVGYLPLGNINLTVVQMSVGEEKRKWQAFILFAAVMEFIYCFGSLSGMQLLRKDTQLIFALNWSAVLIFFVLGVISILHKEKPEKKKELLSSNIKRGVLIAIFNPLQIPFWMIWGVYVMENGWVKSEYNSIGLFSFVCALGTVAVLYMYAVAGKKIVEKLNVNRTILNRFIGVILIALAVYQTVKLLHYS